MLDKKIYHNKVTHVKSILMSTYEGSQAIPILNELLQQSIDLEEALISSISMMLNFQIDLNLNHNQIYEKVDRSLPFLKMDRIIDDREYIQFRKEFILTCSKDIVQECFRQKFKITYIGVCKETGYSGYRFSIVIQ